MREEFERTYSPLYRSYTIFREDDELMISLVTRNPELTIKNGKMVETCERVMKASDFKIAIDALFTDHNSDVIPEIDEILKRANNDMMLLKRSPHLDSVSFSLGR